MLLSVFSSEHIKDVMNRIEQLKPNTPAVWGKMKVEQMLTHCQRPIHVALGDTKASQSFLGKLFVPFIKKNIFGPKDFDRNMPTDKTFIVSDERNFEEEKTKLKNLVMRLHSGGENGVTKDPHPFFGKMEPAQWDRLIYKHLDHHLRQFGV